MKNLWDCVKEMNANAWKVNFFFLKMFFYLIWWQFNALDKIILNHKGKSP